MFKSIAQSVIRNAQYLALGASAMFALTMLALLALALLVNAQGITIDIAVPFLK